MKTFFENRHQDVHRDGDPDLGFDGVLGSPEERLDPQVLLDPFEKQFDLPAGLVKQGDAFRRKGKIVGEKREGLSLLDVEKPDASELVGVIFRRVEAGQCDRLVGFHPGRQVDRMGVDPSELKVPLGAGNEEGKALSQGVESGIIQVCPVHHIVGPRFRDEVVEDVHIAHFAVGDFDERRDVPAQVQQRMHLDGSLVLSEPCPRKKGKAQVDRRGVEGIHRMVQLYGQWIVDVEAAGDMNQHLGEVGIDAPVPVFVGVGQRVSGDAPANSHVVQLRLNRSQAGFDVPKTFPVGQLGEGHAEELIQA